ncbi:recombination protein RecA [Bryocella elongata]|uniref:Protein RecA n=1 Tax=Bryocella elongata TaxID=863522 RepID=A0A1H6AWF0_9BACT|nr:hypothetical protein [Bryocella elongata]SEG52116.1 recombination protein RecA [Bryocella elongata]
MCALTLSTQTRLQVESALARKAPSALTPRPRTIRERMGSGSEILDHLLDGGLPVGAVSEFVGITGSGRTTMALAFAAAMAQEARVAAWVDVADAFDPASAALNGVDLERLLWVRCACTGAPSADKGGEAMAPSRSTMLHATQPPSPLRGGGSPHPRSEGLGMPEAIQAMMQAHGGLNDHQERRERKKVGTPGMPNRPLSPVLDREEQVPTDRQPPRREKVIRGVQAGRDNAGRRVDIQAMEAAQGGPRCAEPKPHPRKSPETAQVKAAVMQAAAAQAARALDPVRQTSGATSAPRPKRSWTDLDHALRVTDLLLQAGGFGLIVLDLGDTPAERSWRIPLATWFRYRAACERSRTSLLLLTQHPCARSSAELVVRMEAGVMESAGKVLTGMRFRMEIERQRFQHVQAEYESNLVAFRKAPQRAEPGEAKGMWRGRASWAV